MDEEEVANSNHMETLTNTICYCESQGPEQESLIEDLDTRMEDVLNLIGIVKKQQTSYNNYNNEQRLLFMYYTTAFVLMKIKNI
ncbi:hypothetical protein BDF21DRAFT_417106 [Thamnidium elegans]|nr:hypothetical protein BDF21DRAFT_417106 [Thamnidium elegans]